MRPSYFALLLLVLGFQNSLLAGDGLSRAELGQRGKAATALVEVRPRSAYAAAFCVHASGLFVTTEQALRPRGDADTVTLILGPGLKTQKVCKATVARIDADANLALLRVTGEEKLAALPLGSEDELTELLELVAFGFPFAAPVAEGEYPSLNARLTHISGLRRKAGELLSVQVDTALSAGFAGGVVLAPKGRAVGVIVSGDTPESTQVIPIGHVQRFLARPDVQFTPPALTAANRSQPHLFEVRVTSLLPSTTPVDVTLLLKGDDGKEHAHKLERADGVYRVKAAPAAGTAAPLRMFLRLTLPDGALSGLASDQPFTVGGAALHLSQVRELHFGPKPRVVLHDGKEHAGPLTGLETVEMRIDEKPIRMKLAEATVAQLHPPQEPSAVTYTLRVTQDGKEVAQLTGELGTSRVPGTTRGGLAGIKPPLLTSEEVVKNLPATAGEVCVAGGGRFLILHLPQQRKLAVFDVNAAQVVRYLSVAEDTIRFTAGLDKLFVALPGANVLQRWSLTTFEREVTVPLPVAGQVRALAMGHATHGPLVVGTTQQHPGFPHGLLLLDPVTFKPSEFKLPEGMHFGIDDHGARLRVSADGSVITGSGALVRQGKTYKHVSVQGGVVPGPDGRTLYTPGQMYTAEGRPLGQRTGGHGQAVWYVPALHGPYYVSLNEAREGQGQQYLSLRVHIVGDSRPLVTLPRLSALEGLVNWTYGQPGQFDRHVFLIPEAQLLVILPPTNDRLILRRFNLDDMLEKAGIDFLFVTSQPPTQFQSGTPWTYQLAIKSKRGSVKVKLESGPAGLTVSPTGLVRWMPPSDADAKDHDVLLTISDASGQEVFHTFTLTRGDRAPATGQPTFPVQPALPSPTFDKDPRFDKDPPKPKFEEPAKPGANAAVPGALVRAPANTLPIKHAPLKEAKATLALPGAIRDVAVGGGGRFLILHLPQQRQFAIFDVNEAKVAKYLSLAEDNVLFAASMDKLVVVLPDKALVQRWSLTTFEREVTAPLPITGRVASVAMGAGSDGPLVLTSPELRAPTGLPLRFLDIHTLKEVVAESKQGGGHIGTHPQYPATLRISSDGRVLGMWNPGLSPSGLQTVVVEGGGLRSYHEHTSVGHIIPSADGKILCTGNGLYTAELKRLSAEPRGGATYPALHGSYYLSVNDAGKSVAVHMFGDTRPLVTLNDVEGLAEASDTPGGPPIPRIGDIGSGSALPLEKRLFLIPLGQLIVSIPATADKLHLYRFQLDEALEKAGIDYLLITSQPVTAAAKGKPYTYALAVKSKKGGVKYKLEAGPAGMKLAADGKLTWTVPTDFAEAEVDVIIAVSDTTGQEIFQTFKVRVGE